MYIATQTMEYKEKAELTKMFAMIDKDADGKLSREELIQGYSLINNSSEEVLKEIDEIMKNVDADDNGCISYSEFLVALMNKKRILSENNLRQAFDAFDVKRRKCISIEEIKSVLGVSKDIDEEVWKALIDEVDQNKDGLINFEEFQSMMLQAMS